MISKAIVKFTKTDENIKTPSYGSISSAGADLSAICDQGSITIPSHETVMIKTGISVELPEGTVGLICARSGIAKNKSLAPANKVGVIDSDYRGELIVALHNHSNSSQTISNGERIAQLLIVPYIKADFKEVNSLSCTDRGCNGFGSTGK